MVLAFVAFAFMIQCGGSGTVIVNAQSRNAARTLTNFAKLRESLTNRILDFEPEEKRILGDRAAAGHLKDWSPEAIREEVKFCQDGLKQLAAVQPSDPAERLDREVLAAHLAYLNYYYGQYHGELGNLQISAYPYDLIQYELQRFATSKPDAALAREHFGAVESILRKLPNYLKQQESNLTAGLKLRKPDREILQTLIERIGSADIQDSIRDGLKQLASSLGSARMQALLTTAQRESLRQALQSADAAYANHANFLKNRLLPEAGDSWALGEKEYQRRFALIYGDRISLEDLVREAEAELQRINEEMTKLARELRPNMSLSSALEELHKQHPATEQELLKAYEQVQKRIDDGLTLKLGLPVGAARYLPAPPGVRVDSATNWPAPLLTRGPGIVLVNTSPVGLTNNATLSLVWIAAHEGNPGHAAQSLLFQSAFNEERAPLCRFLNVPDEVGYVRGNWYAMANIEGWAFYTERLLLASGLLTREERLAALTGQALRAARIVVDVRLHTLGWSRQDVAKYLNKNAGLSPASARAQAYRYSWIPLQALSYYFGARQFEELQERYAGRFGSDFYRQLLSLGPVPRGSSLNISKPQGRRRRRVIDSR